MMNEWMNDWVNEWVSEWVSEWVNEWMNEYKNKYINEQNKYINKQIMKIKFLQSNDIILPSVRISATFSFSCEMFCDKTVCIIHYS